MTEFKETELDERAINMAKVLSADAVEKAGSGHPGSPVSLAPVAYTLYQHFIKHDPNDPNSPATASLWTTSSTSAAARTPAPRATPSTA